MKKIIFLSVLCCLLSAFGVQAQKIIYVKADATGANDGSSWANAFTHFQDGVNATSAGDHVFVAGGTYQPDAGQSFSMKEGVKIYGGFAGTETNLGQRDLSAGNTSILKGNGNRVIYNNDNGLDTAARLDGFKVSGGSVPGNGGGIYNNNVSPTIVNCIFTGNTTGSDGGGMSNEKSAPVILNCTFSGNTATYNGGALFNDFSSPTITNCIFSGNKAVTGGGIYNDNASSAIITNCTISGNNASIGTGVVNENSSPVISNCIIYGNRNEIINYPNSNPVITYSLIQGIPEDAAKHNLDGTIIPHFVDAPSYATAPFTGGDYHLQSLSPAINTGSNDSIPAGTVTDLAGDPRISRYTVDLGAYEYQSPPIIPSAAGILYIDSAATQDGDGSSWQKALPNLADALRAADTLNSHTNGTVKQIWVARGTYQPEAGESFYMLPKVKIYGGFAGTETNLGQRDLSAGNTSILKGNGNRVIYNNDNGLDTAARLDGFKVSGGSVPVNGGGICNNNVAPTIVNCIFTGNTTGSDGGGMSNEKSAPVILNCTFSGNTATYNGGALFNDFSSPTITNCIFSGNKAVTGGGIYNDNASSAIIINCTISGNNASTGTGVVNENSSPVISNCIIYGNRNEITNIANSNPVITYSLIQGISEDAAKHNLDGTINPHFVDAPSYATAPFTGGDYHLQSLSPAINRGSNDSIPAGTATDLAGDPRISRYTVDLGAYEYQFPPIAPSTAGILYVDSAATQDGDGSSWQKALPQLADALRAADTLNSHAGGTVKQIWVARGTYQPLYKVAEKDNKGTPTTDRDKSFIMVKDVQLYGSFAGTETSLSQRDVTKLFTTNRTVLTGSLSGKDTAYHVLILAGNVGSASVDGFTITGGNANEAYTTYVPNVMVNGENIETISGGGVYNAQASPKLTNIAIIGNGANHAGGGMYNVYSAPLLTNVIINNNKGLGAGGGIYNTHSSPVLINVVIGNDTTTGDGGGIYNDESSPILTNTTISGNVAIYGGGMNNTSSSRIVVRNSIIYGNSAANSGAEIYSDHTSGVDYAYSLVDSSFYKDNTPFDTASTTENKLFNDALAGDYTLRAGAWVINKGNNIYYSRDSIPDISADTLDLAGNPRIFDKAQGGIVDLGAYEYQGNPKPPVITAQPADITVCENTAAVFEIMASGDTLTFQWQSSTDGTTWKNISSATLDTLKLSSVTPADSGTLYRAILNNVWSADTSNTATLNVNRTVAISLQPVSVAVCEGQAASFSVTASGSNLRYQWQSSANNINWTDITGETAATLTLSNVQTAESGMKYHVIVSGNCGNVTSDSATLTVYANATITTQPKNQTICENGDASFSVSATGTRITYQWQSSADGSTWANVADGTSATLSLSNVQTAASGTSYHVIVGSACEDATSDAVTLTVNPLPKITITADGANPVSKGIPTHLTVSGADGYQWANGSGIQSGWNDATLAIRPEQDATYTVTGTSAEGCTMQQSYAVHIVEDYKLVCNNIVSPNGDGKNDTWIIQNIGSYSNNKVMIFDRAGRMIYEKKNYDNQWNGMLNGGPLHEGTYYYVFIVDGGKKVFKGYIELLRGRP